MFSYGPIPMDVPVLIDQEEYPLHLGTDTDCCLEYYAEAMEDRHEGRKRERERKRDRERDRDRARERGRKSKENPY